MSIDAIIQALNKTGCKVNPENISVCKDLAVLFNISLVEAAEIVFWHNA